MKRTCIEQVERRLLFAGVTLDAGPVPVQAVTGQFAPIATAPIGTSGNSLFVVARNGALFGTILDPTGVAVGPEFKISAAGQTVVIPAAVSALALSSGNVAVAYQAQVTGSPSDYGNIEVAEVSPAGVPMAPVQAAPGVAGYQNNPSLAAHGSKLHVVFTSAANIGTVNSSVYLDTLDAGTLAEIGSATQLNVAPASPPFGIVNDHASAAVDSGGDLVVEFNERDYDAQLNTLGSAVIGVRVDGTTGAASAPFSILRHGGNLTLFGNPCAVGSTSGFGCAVGVATYDSNFALTGSSALFIAGGDLSGDGSGDIVTSTLVQTDASAQVGVAGAAAIPSSVAGQPPIVFVTLSSGTHGGNGLAVTSCDFAMASCDPNVAVPATTGTLFPARADVDSAIWVDSNGNPYVYAYNTAVADDYSSTAISYYRYGVAVPSHASGQTVSVEGATGATVTDAANVPPLSFPITLSGPATEPVTVRFRTLDSDPSTTAGGNYTPTDVTLTIPEGQQSVNATVPVTAVGDLTLGEIAVEITTTTGGVTVATGRAIGYLPHLAESGKPFRFSVSVGQASLTPGQKTTATLTIERSSTAPSNAPKAGSGELKVTATLPGGATRVIADQNIKVNLAKPSAQTTKVNVVVPATLPEGTYSLNATFTGSAKSQITTANSDVSVTPAPGQSAATIDVRNVFSSGTTIIAQDADGTGARFSLKGPGQGRLVKNDDGTFDLVFTGTTAATSVTITAPASGPGSGGNGRLDVRNITTDGPIGKVQATCVDVSGNITLGGPISNGAFGNVRDGHVITLPSSATAATLSFLSLANVTFNSGQPIAALAVQDWTDSDSTADVLTAPSIGKLAATGNFEAGLSVAGTVGALSVGGTLGGTTAHTLSAANFGKVTVGSVRNTDLFAGVIVSGLPALAADFGSAASAIAGFAMRGTFSNSSIAARTLGPIVLTSVTTTGGSPFGVAALTFKSYSRDKAKKPIPSAPGIFDMAGSFSARKVG